MSSFFIFLILAFSFSASAENLCQFTPEEIAHASVEQIDKINRHPNNCTTGSAMPNKWKLVWSDEFNGEGKPDPTKWTTVVDGSGMGNNEDQYYTNREKNAYQKDGHLVIQADKEDYQGKHYTSARLISKQSFTYGRIEFRAKVPTGKGTWPAAWLLPDTGNWPDNGEIDVLESVGHEQNINHFSLQTKDYNFINGKQQTFQRMVDKANQDYHTYAVNWYPDHMDYQVDGVTLFTAKKDPKGGRGQWPFDKDFHLILNLAIGGNWGRQQGIDDSIFPAKFEIDYVRVYRPVNPLDCQPHL